MLVRVDDDGVCLIDYGVCGASSRVEGIGYEPEVAAIGCVDVNAEVVTAAERENLMQGIHGADGGGAEGDDHRADISFAKLIFESIEPHAAAVVGWNRREVELEHP